MLNIQKVNLGKTGLKVSKLGFGTFDFGVSSLNLSPNEGGHILLESFKLGVNFWDTSEDYGSHLHVVSALKNVSRREVVISTKTNAQSGEEADKSLKNSLRELDTDYIDIFMLHNVKHEWIDGCHQVLKLLNEVKEAGIVKAVGLSTHSVAVVRKASQFREVDVIMATCCKANQAVVDKFRDYIPLEDGSMEEMLAELELAHELGKGIIAMKVLGTGAAPLVKTYQSSIKFIAGLDFVDGMVIGMRSVEEVKKNVKVVSSVS